MNWSFVFLRVSSETCNVRYPSASIWWQVCAYHQQSCSLKHLLVGDLCCGFTRKYAKNILTRRFTTNMNMAYAQPLVESERYGHPSNARRFSSRVCNDIMMQIMMFRTRDKILRCFFFHLWYPTFGTDREIDLYIFCCRSLFSLWAQRRCFSCYSWWEIWSAFKVRCLVGCSTRWVAADRNFVKRKYWVSNWVQILEH